LLEHLFHIGKAELAGAMLPQRVQLAGSDLIALDRVRLGMMGAHVLDEATRDPCQGR
jgi:hypothetical protein